MPAEQAAAWHQSVARAPGDGVTPRPTRPELAALKARIAAATVSKSAADSDHKLVVDHRTPTNESLMKL